MKTLVRTLALAPLIAVLTSPLGAQGVGGRWIAELDRVVRNENGNVSTSEKAKVRLVLEQRGDSVVGTLGPVDPSAGSAAPTRALRGTVSGTRVTLSSEADVRRNMNGEESVQRVTIVYDLTLDGDTLQGTMVAKTPDRDMPPRPFSARREKL